VMYLYVIRLLKVKLETVEIAILPCNYDNVTNMPVFSSENATIFRNIDSCNHKMLVMLLYKMQIILCELLQAWNVISVMSVHLLDAANYTDHYEGKHPPDVQVFSSSVKDFLDFTLSFS